MGTRPIYNDAAIVFCSDHAGTWIRLSDGYYDDQVRLKEAALLFSNVIPVGCEPSGFLLLSKQYGYPYDLLNSLTPNINEDVLAKVLFNFRDEFHSKNFFRLRKKFHFFKKSWKDDSYTIEKEHILNLKRDYKLLQCEKLIADSVLTELQNGELFEIDNSYIYSVLFAKNSSFYGNNKVRNALDRLAYQLGFINYCPFLNNQAIGANLSEHYTVYSVVLNNLPIIDFKKIEWENIFELRSDLDSFSKMRRLRVFILDNFIGKSVAFIEDKFGETLSEYERSLKKHGIETRLGSLEQILSSKTLLASIGIIIGALLIGQPLVASATAISESILEGTKTMLYLAKRNYDFVELSNNHPLAYIHDLKKLESVG